MTPNQVRRSERLLSSRLPCVVCLKDELESAEFTASGGWERTWLQFQRGVTALAEAAGVEPPPQREFTPEDISIAQIER